MTVWEDFAGDFAVEGEMRPQGTSFAFLTWVADIPSLLLKKKEAVCQRPIGLVRPYTEAKEQLS